MMTTSEFNTESNIITKIQPNDNVDFGISTSYIKFNMIMPKFANKESIEIYMQTVVNFYDNNPKFDYV